MDEVSSGHTAGPQVQPPKQTEGRQLEVLGELHVFLKSSLPRIQEQVSEKALRHQMQALEQLKAILADLERTGKSIKPMAPPASPPAVQGVADLLSEVRPGGGGRVRGRALRWLTGALSGSCRS